MKFKSNIALSIAFSMLMLFVFSASASYAEGTVDVGGYGFYVPTEGYVFLSVDSYVAAIVEGNGDPIYDYFFVAGTYKLKYDIYMYADTLGRHADVGEYVDSILDLGYTSATFAEVMNNIPEDKLLDETFLTQVKEAKAVDGKLEFEPYIEPTEPEPTEPTAKLTITPDPILKNNFNLASVQANILGVENVDKYAIKYSVKDANDNKHYVTTKKASIKQTNPDLIQYIENETELEVLIYDTNGKLIAVENLKVEIN